MLNAYEYIKQELPHLSSQDQIDPVDLQYAMQEYAQYITAQQVKPLIEEYTKQSYKFADKYSPIEYESGEFKGKEEALDQVIEDLKQLLND
jgi:regulator of sigma D